MNSTRTGLNYQSLGLLIWTLLVTQIGCQVDKNQKMEMDLYNLMQNDAGYFEHSDNQKLSKFSR